MIIKIRKILISLVILFISSVLVDGGRTIMLVSDSTLVHLNHDHQDLEIPHQHKLNGFPHDEEFLNLNSNTFPCSFKRFFLSTLICDIKNQDYASLIWQPPKSE